MRADRSRGCLVLLLLAALCAGPARAGEIRLAGGGATFALPLYSKWFAEYAKAHPEVVVDYQPIGSAAGVRGFFEQKLDLAGTDVPLGDEQVGKAGVKSIH